MENKNTGLIIGSLDYKEKSKIVYLYTPNGKKSVLAGGSKCIKNNMLGFTTTLNQVDYISTSSNLPKLIEYNLIRSNYDLITSIDKIETIKSIIKIVQLIPEDSNHSKVYSFIIESIDSLYVINPKKVLSIFLIKMLYIFGVNPNLNSCIHCGKNEIYSFSIYHGGGYCKEHSSSNDLSNYNIWREYYYEKKNMSTYTDTDFDVLLKEISKYYSIYAHIDLKL
jgi:DNA repair protein RecO (recombination protein O)